MKSFMQKTVALLWLTFLPVTWAVAETSIDIPLESAKFENNRGNNLLALNILSTADEVSPRVDNSERLVLKAKLLVDLNRFDEARRLFGQLQVKSRALDLMQSIAFPLAQLDFANGDCKQALRFLSVGSNYSVEQASEGFFMRASCLVDDKNASLQQLNDLHEQIQLYLNEHKKPASLWLAYTYYNLAIAALNQEAMSVAEGYFEQTYQVLARVNSAESAALREKTLLTVAYASYGVNQYESAMAAYAKINLEGLWVDQALLGYGWSAFYNYQRGLALESWRQLIAMPNKSMSVYEGLLAIPFALEKANAFSRALTAYDEAIVEYEQALGQIAVLEKTLTTSAIREHALEYINSKGRRIEPLHPLLGATYTQPLFRSAVERVGDIANDRQSLVAYEKQLAIFAQVKDWQRGEQSAENKAAVVSLEHRLREYFQQVVKLRELILNEAFDAGRMSPELAAKYGRYLSLRRISLANGGVATDKLEKLQGLVFWESFDEGAYSRESFQQLNSLVQLHQRLENKLLAYQESLSIKETSRPTTAQFNAVLQRIAAAEKKNEIVANQAEQYLLDITLGALADFGEELVEYQKQARIASARLREEFYQVGGRRL